MSAVIGGILIGIGAGLVVAVVVVGVIAWKFRNFKAFK